MFASLCFVVCQTFAAWKRNRLATIDNSSAASPAFSLKRTIDKAKTLAGDYWKDKMAQHEEREVMSSCHQ